MPVTVLDPPKSARPKVRFTYHERPASIPSPVDTLRVNELLFLTEYFRNGRNGTQAYRAVHPASKHTSASVSATRLLQKARVQAEIARRTRYDVGVTKEWGQTRLLDYEAMALAKQDYLGGASIVMDAMKLGGFITEKREVKTISDAQRTAIRDLVASALGTAHNAQSVKLPDGGLSSTVEPTTQ